VDSTPRGKEEKKEGKRFEQLEQRSSKERVSSGQPIGEKGKKEKRGKKSAVPTNLSDGVEAGIFFEKDESGGEHAKLEHCPPS